MVTYAFNREGLPIYDARGRNLITIGGDTYDIVGTRIWHFNADGEPCAGGETDPAGPVVRQPPLVARLQFLMSISGPRPFATAAGAVRIATVFLLDEGSHELSGTRKANCNVHI